MRGGLSATQGRVLLAAWRGRGYWKRADGLLRSAIRGHWTAPDTILMPNRCRRTQAHPKGSRVLTQRKSRPTGPGAGGMHPFLLACLTRCRHAAHVGCEVQPATDAPSCWLRGEGLIRLRGQRKSPQPKASTDGRKSRRERGLKQGLRRSQPTARGYWPARGSRRAGRGPAPEPWWSLISQLGPGPTRPGPAPRLGRRADE